MLYSSAILPHPVKALIVALGLTQREVSADLGVNEHTFGRVINGHADPWPKLSRDLAALLDEDEEDLWHAREVVAS